MSLQNKISLAVEEVINTFIKKVSNTHNISEKELRTLWGTNQSKKEVKTQQNVEEVETSNLNKDDLMKLKKTELQKLCREKGVKCTGTKSQLVSFLQNNSVSTPSKKPSENQVVKKLVSNKPSFFIRRNKFGNHIHPETYLVFDKKSKKVIGKQDENGNVRSLTPEDIETCKNYKFDYELPLNLDTEKIDEVEIDELDDLLEEEDEVEEELLDEVKEEVEVEEELLDEVEDEVEVEDEDEDEDEVEVEDEDEDEVEVEVEVEDEDEDEVEVEDEVEDGVEDEELLEEELLEEEEFDEELLEEYLEYE